MKLSTLYEDIEPITDLASSYIMAGCSQHVAVFKTLDKLGIRSLKDRLRIGNEIKKKMNLKEKIKRQQKMREIPNHYI